MWKFLSAIVVLLLGSALTQDPGCDYYQQIDPGRSYSVNSPNYPSNYSGTLACRWIAVCPSGYNCRLDCPEVNIPYTASCTTDRLLVSRSGDPQLNAAQQYCGSGTITNVVSDQQQMSIGLITSNSRGGRFQCRVAAQLASGSSSCQCGYKKTNRIVGGVETGVNEYPMMVGLVDLQIREMKCGAVIIDRRWVLTAAHCIQGRSSSDFAVVVGEHNIETGSDTNAVQVLSSNGFIIHPQFNRQTYDYDIALIRLTQDIQFNNNVGPVCLPFKYQNTDFTGRNVTALGWGTLFIGGPKPNALRKVDLPVISQSACRSASASVTSRQICTYEPGKDACQDDSGGPLLFTDPTTGLLFNVGVISYGTLCATAGRPGVNTRVSNAELLQWIVANTQANFCRR